MARFFLVLMCLFSLGCSGPKDENQKPKILVTIPPYADLVRTLVADGADIEIFVPPGANPHTYEPTPQQIKNFAHAKIWFRIGDPIEQKMAHVLKNRVQIVDLSTGVATLDEPSHGHSHENGKDLHVWLDPTLTIEQVKVMTSVLIKEFPGMTDLILTNSANLIDELKELDLKIKGLLEPFRGDYLLVSHPALGYYCLRYGMQQLPIEIEGKDPLPQDITRLVSHLKAHPVPVVFIEPQYNNKGALMIAEELHIPSVTINPYDEDYFGMLDHITDTIVKYYDHPNS